jgi:hypothetical protein
MSVSFTYSRMSPTGILWAVRHLANTGKIAPTDVCSFNSIIQVRKFEQMKIKKTL